MGELAAKEGDKISGKDVHNVITDPLSGPKPVPGHTFDGELSESLSSNVFIDGKAAATIGSIAKFRHKPNGMSFGKDPKHEGEASGGSGSVFINGEKAARNGDRATTGNDPTIEESSEVKVEDSSVSIGD